MDAGSEELDLERSVLDFAVLAYQLIQAERIVEALIGTSAVAIGPRVRLAGRYRMEEGEVEVDSIALIGFPDIAPEWALESGFRGVLDLLKVAKHGRGENVYLIRFHYVRPRAKRKGRSLGRI